MIEQIIKFREYLNYLEEHYRNVQKAWKIIQEKCDGKCFPFLYDDSKFFTLDKMVKEHDLSKLSPEEFGQYRKSFFPTASEDKNDAKAEFEFAWEHHKRANSHHWESAKDELDVAHMVCDWMAMGMKFNDTAKEYYEKNKDKIKLPEWAVRIIYEIFACVYEEKPRAAVNG